jgi:hypothetical protein
MKKHINYEDIPKKAIVNAYYEDGTMGQFGIVKGADLHYMLRGFILNKELGLWFSDKHKDFAYGVTPIE